MEDYRVLLESQEGNLITTGILLNPEGEELIKKNKRKEMSPKQKKMLADKLANEGDEKAIFDMYAGGFIYMYYVKNEVLFNDINLETSNISRIIYLATFIDWNSGRENLLVKPGQFNKSYPMTKRDMQFLLGLADRTFTDFLKDVKDNGLLYELEDEFYLDPDYFNKGKSTFKEKEYTRLYINTVRDLFQQSNPRNHKQLSYLFKLIPKMYHLNNAIVHNPEVQDISSVRYMKLKELCEFIGVGTDSRTTSRIKRDLLKFCVSNGGVKRGVFKHVTVEGSNNRYSYFVINPSIIYSGSDFKVANDILKLCYFNDEE